MPRVPSYIGFAIPLGNTGVVERGGLAATWARAGLPVLSAQTCTLEKHLSMRIRGFWRLTDSNTVAEVFVLWTSGSSSILANQYYNNLIYYDLSIYKILSFN